MAHLPAAPAAIDISGHGLRFLNEDWNDSISDGQPFILKWNQSLEKQNTQLGLYRLRYPHEGLVEYELVSNLTDSIEAESCTWTPEGLSHDLYAVWLSTGQRMQRNWTISPPWSPKEETKPGLHLAAPIGIPLLCLLVLYGICLTIYLLHRRRKREEREKKDATPHQDVSRNNSVDSEITVQTLTDTENGMSKPRIWIIHHSSQGEDINTQIPWQKEENEVDTSNPGIRLASRSPA